MHEYLAARIISNTMVGENVSHLKVSLSQALAFEAGQFFMLRLRGSTGDFIERSYSAANFSSGDILEFVIRIEAYGQMSALIPSLSPESLIDVKGPFGKFGRMSLKEDPKKIILIAGGVGISPFRSFIQQSLFRGESFPIELFYGFRTGKDFLFQEEFKNSDRLKVIPAISEEDTTWTGERGFISEILSEYLQPDPESQIFICGPPPMVKATREKLFSLGFDRKQVHVEAW